VANLCTDRLRKRGRTDVPLDAVGDPEDPSPGPEAALQTQARRAALARARIAQRDGSRDRQALIDALPADLRADGGLAYERFRRLDRADRDAEAEQALLRASTSAAGLGRPSAWADRRRTLARRAERAGRATAAYAIASSHFSAPDIGYAYADLEWLSGWIALRRLIR
ncbi:MAG: hypothetical protein AAFU61_18480, partial [Pseudomonadota bacterium]